MPENISLYLAKATLSAVIRAVREGACYTITLHGHPVAELRPIEPEPTRKQTLAERIAELEARGEIGAPKGSAKDLLDLPARKHVRGAMQRFLNDRE